MPSRRYVVRIRMPVLMSPFSEIMPTAPPYQPRASFSRASMVCAAAFLGAPITVTAHMWLRNASSESKPSFRNALHVIHRVEHAGVGFDQPPADHLHRARLADARLVVAVHVGAHGQLGFFLGAIQQLANVVGIAQRIAGALRRAGDGAGLDARALHAHEHLRRRADQLLVAELQQELVRAGAGRLHALEQLAGLAGVRRAEGLAQHHFVVIAAAHAFAHRLHVRHVLFGRVVGDDRAGLRAARAAAIASPSRARPRVVAPSRSKSYW